MTVRSIPLPTRIRLLPRRLVPALAAGALACAVHGRSTPTPSGPEPLALTYEFAPVAGDSALPVRLRLTLSHAPDSVFLLVLPNEWAGRSRLYENIAGLRAVSRGARVAGTGRPDRAQVRATPGAPVTIEWSLRATPPSSSAKDAHNHSDIGRDVAQLVGYDALIIPAWRASTPVEATFVFRNLAPDAPIATSFGARRTVRDSVLVAQTQLGNLLHALYSFGVRPGARAYDRVLEGGPVMVLIRGHLTIPDSVLVDGVQRVIAAERAFWGTRPPSDYTISIGVAPRGSLAGMRVTNAFVADIDSTRTMDSDVIMLFAHELMHEWIGGMLHSASAVRDGELGWFTEGFTDYETKRVLRASHIITDSAYVALVNRSLADHAVSTASDSSWDAIVKGFWRDGAMQREPYLRGELLAIRLDAAIRTATNDRRSLDALLQELVRDRDLAAAGLTESLFASRVQREVGDLPVAREIASALAGGAITLPDGALGACAQPRMQQRARWDPGFDVDGSLRAGSMTAVRPGGPADKAGLREGMKIGRASISRGDATRKLELGVKTDTGLVTYGYLPAGATVRVQQFVPRSSCQ